MEKVQLKVELGISAQKILQQVQIHNQDVADLVARGVQEAVDELCNGDSIVLMAKEKALDEFKKIIHEKAISWEVRNKISDEIEKRVSSKISDYADKIAEKFTQNIV